jgi:predicted Ser/Thr protein kinase
MALTITIDGVSVPFYPIPPVQSAQNKYYADVEKQFFLKKSSVSGIHNEVTFLTLLQKYDTHFPKLITHSTDYIVLRFIRGDYITKTNVPPDFGKQIDDIINILNMERICHNDLHRKQVLVENGILYLIDFANARFFPSEITTNQNRPHNRRRNRHVNSNGRLRGILRV